MTQNRVPLNPVPRALRLAVIAGSITGTLLFAWSIRNAGTQPVIAGVTRIGTGFVLVFLLGGVRHFVRTVAWTFCVEPPDRLPIASALAAYLAGDSLGNVTPFGFLVSEPAKIVLVGSRVTLKASISALAVENLFYGGTVAVVLIAGTAVLLLAFPVPYAVRLASFAIFGCAAGFGGAMIWVVAQRRRLASGLFAQAIRRNIARAYFESRLAHVREVEDQIFDFVGRRPERLVPILVLEGAFHVAAILEIFMVLMFVTGSPPGFLLTVALEYTNRTITSVFQFVPMWLGVDEAGTGLMTTALHLGPALGVTLALIRKGRLMAWTAVGIALLMHQGLSLRGTLREAALLRS